MSRFIKRLNRWRHSRGFGVHSPYAYQLVCEIVRPDPRYGYYGYHDIERAVMEAHVSSSTETRFIRRACLLLRCVANLRPASVWLPPSSASCMTVAVAKGGSCRLTAQVKDCELMVLSEPKAEDIDSMKRHITTHGHSLLVFGAGVGLATELSKVMTDGLILYGLSTLLAVSRPNMPLVLHAVNFS
ncbi:MAG: hypothetical protein K2K26_00315 [Muribaculaceae bacterium]|nr:hypothetical protein [Muribaculaceae bacterium]